MFTGRDSEIDLLERLQAEALDHFRLVIVHGGAGIGKTSLMREFAERSRNRGEDIIWGRLRETSIESEYQVWVQLARNWIWRNRSDDRARAAFQAASERLAPLATIVAGISEYIGTHPVHRGSTPAAVGEAIAEFVRSVSAVRPTSIILEDLHIAAPSTLSVLKILLDGPEVPLLIGATSRSPIDLRSAGPPKVTTLRLGSLPRESVGLLCREAAPQLEQEPIEQVYEHTRGNPLLVAEVAELIRLEGRPLFSENGDAFAWKRRIAHRVRPIYRSRIKRLGEAQRTALLYAAALGESIHPEKLRACLGSSDDTLIRTALDAGAALGFLTREGNGPLEFSFQSELARQAVLETVDATERAGIHESVGHALESYYAAESGTNAAELSDHFLRSVHPEAISKGIEWVRIAGRQAVESHSWDEARTGYARLLNDHGERLDEATKAEVHYGLGRALLHSGEKMKAVPHLGAAMKYFKRTGDIARMVELSRQVISYEIGDVHYFSYVETALKSVPPGSDAYDSLFFFYGVGQMEAVGNYPVAWEILSHQLERARSTGSEQMESACLTALAYIDVRYSRIQEAIAKCELVMERCRRRPDPFSFVHGRFVLMQSQLAKRDSPSALAHILKAGDPTRELGNNVITAGWYGMVARFALRAGDWEQARSLCADGLAYDPDSPLLLPLSAAIEYETGNRAIGDEVLERLIRAISVYPSGPYLVYASTALAVMARSCIFEDYHRVPVAKKLAEMLLSGECPPAVGLRALLAMGAIAIVDEDRDLARRTYLQLRSAPRLNLVRDYRVELLLGRIAEFLTRQGAARRHFEKAQQDAESYPDRPFLGWVHLYQGAMTYGQLGWTSHEADRRVHHLREALRIARELGMAPLERRSKELLEAAGGFPSRRERIGSRSDPDDRVQERTSRLSSRELQVLRLLAEGMSDKEIAGVLGLSVHTVSNHVRHILHKTRAANRLVAVNVGKQEGAL